MSNSNAIASVTAILRKRLIEGLSDFPGTTVTTKPLDLARDGRERPSQVNLFLFQTEVNATLGRSGHAGPVRVGEMPQPPLALDLKYLITAYGENDDTTDQHRLLGRAMTVLLDHPIVRPEEIATAFPGAEVDTAPEGVQISPLPLTLEEMARLWNTFRTEYRLSTAYTARIVLIDGEMAQPASAYPRE